MKKFARITIAASIALASTAPTWAHGDKPHPTCKKGYELNDEHKCVKKN